jgi:esterase/lipase superfamily enzyme
MNIEYHKWYSQRLGRDMELKVYGHSGKSFLLFPTQGGRFYQAEDEGIMEAMSDYLWSGRINFICVDSVDDEAWPNRNIPVHQRGLRHLQFEEYIIREVVPFISNHFNRHNVKIGCTGFSMGAYHAANFFFKHPWQFNTLVAISGFYNLKLITGDDQDDLVYFNSPIQFLNNLSNEEILKLLRESQIVFCSGQGDREEEMLNETLEMKSILETKSIPAWFDIWGKDVNHDWPWWRKMLPYFIGKLGY